MKRRDFLKFGGAGLAGVAMGGFDLSPFLPLGEADACSTVWRFGVMADTQWRTGLNAGGEPASCAVSIINALNTQFVRHGVKFVIQVGDLVDVESVSGVRSLPTRADAAQALYDAGIGFFPVRGNHEASAIAANEIPVLFPQTLGSGPHVFHAANFESPILDSTSTDPLGERLKGLSYSFDYKGARFVLIDQFTRKDNTSYNGSTNNNAVDQLGWVDSTLSSRKPGTHAFIFSHKNLIGQNHKDVLFGSNLTANAGARNDFITSLQSNGVRYQIGGHDHMHHRSFVRTDDGMAQVGQIICSSNSYKFYIPQTGDDGRENPLQQELFTVGYYVFTVDGPRVTVDFYSSSHGSDYGDINLITPPPTYNFYLRETFGYSLNGKEFEVAPGESYDIVTDTFSRTTARILDGINGNTETDYLSRPLAKTVNTGWTPASKRHGMASDILTLWGIADNLSLWDDPNRGLDLVGLLPDKAESRKTDQYTLSMSYSEKGFSHLHRHHENDNFLLATKNARGHWDNAVEKNFGGRKRFVKGPWNPRYELGTYGVDTRTRTVWAVLNYEGDFAVIRGM